IGRTLNGGSGNNSVAYTLTLYSVYTRGGTVTGHNFVGGLIGENFRSIIIYSYVASGAVTGDYDSSSNSYQVGAVIGGTDCTCNAGSFGGSTGVLWDYETTGLTNSTGKRIDTTGEYLTSVGRWGSSFGPEYYTDGLFWGGNTAQMMTLDPYEHAGWYTGQVLIDTPVYAILTPATAAGQVYSDSNRIANQYFIYEGDTYPLLMVFLTPLTVEVTDQSVPYTGTLQHVTAPYAITQAYDHALLLGSAAGATASGRNAGSYPLTVGGLYSSQLGYSLTITGGGRLTIEPAPLTVGTEPVTKPYDGTTAAAGTAIPTGGTQLLGADMLSGGSFAFADKDAGTGKTVTVSGVTVDDGNGGANYVVTYADNTTSAITPRVLSIGGSLAAGRPYDGTTQAAITPGTLAGLVDGETLAVTATGTFDARHAGSRTATAHYTLADGAGGGLAGNYALADTGGLAATITPAGLTVSTEPVTKPYDGTTAAAGTAIVTSGTLFAGDTLSGGSFAFADKHVGTGKTVTVSGVTVDDGNGGADYAVTYAANTTSAITPMDTAHLPLPSGGTAEVAVSDDAGNTCYFDSAQFVARSSVADPLPAGLALAADLFDFVLDGCAPGATATIRITYPSLPDGAQYWKHGPTPDEHAAHWYQHPATFSGNGVSFAITNGGQGDDDLDGANSRIVDAGGPALRGATLASPAQPIPTLSQWSLLLLPGLLGLAALRRRRV
ncbi:IPTL-CTERM sorting domain-containing protein, partial [Ottowia sp.]|uniref:IPTL-CTERM sorting domain-containing protein n=1 Tax=Ottowia sp. TaxID=1898956 RepID=UPI0039E5D41F